MRMKVLLGLVAFALMPGSVLWYEGDRRDVVTSTFFNPNSFSAYAGIGLVATCGLILKLYRDEFLSVGGSIRYRISMFIDVTGKKATILLAGAFVILVALLLAGSRGGIAAAALSLFCLGVLTTRMPKKQGPVEQRKAILVLGVILVSAVFVVFGDILVGKIARQGFQDDGRAAVYVITLRSIFSAPLLGYGYGTFLDVFPMFRDHSVSAAGIWGQAHNTYLETLQGLGLIFGSMLVITIILLASRCVKGALSRKQVETVPCVAASTAILLGLQALVDFSLQIQAIAITFMAVLGAGVAQSKSSQLRLED